MGPGHESSGRCTIRQRQHAVRIDDADNRRTMSGIPTGEGHTIGVETLDTDTSHRVVRGGKRVIVVGGRNHVSIGVIIRRISII